LKSPRDGDLHLATSGDIQPALRLWDYEIGRDLLSLHGHGAWTQRIEFSPDENLVLAVNSAEVDTMKDFQKAIAQARKSGRAVLLVQRGYRLQEFQFDLG